MPRNYDVTKVLLAFFILAGSLAMLFGLKDIFFPDQPFGAPNKPMNGTMIFSGGSALLAGGLLGRVMIHIAQSSQETATHLAELLRNTTITAAQTTTPVPKTPAETGPTISASYRGHTIERWSTGFFAVGKIHDSESTARAAIDAHLA